MFASGTAWFCVVVGVLLLVEAAVFFVRRNRPGPGAGRRGTPGQVPMLASLGVILICGSVPQLADLSGAASTAFHLVGVVAAVTTLIFAAQSWRALRRNARSSRGQRTGGGRP